MDTARDRREVLVRAPMVVVLAMSSPALAGPSLVVNVGIDYQSQNRGGDDEDSSWGLSGDVAIGGAFTDRIVLAGFARVRTTTSNDDRVFSNDTGQQWFGARVDVAATPLLTAGAGIAVVNLQRHFGDGMGMGVEAHVGFELRPPDLGAVVEPRVEIGRIDADPGIGTIYLRASIGLRF